MPDYINSYQIFDVKIYKTYVWLFSYQIRICISADVTSNLWDHVHLHLNIFKFTSDMMRIKQLDIQTITMLTRNSFCIRLVINIATLLHEDW